MAYATAEEYETYTGATAPSNIALLLARASRDIDQALLTAVYDVDDETGEATDATVIAALNEATIEQVAYWLGVGEDGTGASGSYDDVQIGSVRLARRGSGGAGGGGSAATRLAHQAWQVLQLAGLTGHSPYTYETCEAADG